MKNLKENQFPKVSVIIPTYNRPHLISRAIKSVLNQTYQNFEIVVVDDSENNETEKTVKNFNDKRIKYVHNKQKTTLPAARNLGIKNSDPQSKYIAFLDDDDELLPQFLEKGVQKLEEKKDLIAVISDHIHLLPNGKKIKIDRAVKKPWNTGVGNGSIVKKSLFIKENFWFDEKMVRAEDWDLGIRVLKNHKIESMPYPLFKYYHPDPHTTSLSRKGIPIEVIDYFFEKHISYFRQLGRQPLSFFYFYLAKLYARSGAIKKGQKFFLKAFTQIPNPIYLLYYLFWRFPVFAKKFQLENLLDRIYEKI